MPASYDMTIWRGNDFSMECRFKDGTAAFDLTGSTLFWRAKWDGGSLEKQMTIASPATGIATLALTYAETRRLKNDKDTSYEIERRVGGRETTLLYGAVTVSGGVNSDAA